MTSKSAKENKRLLARTESVLPQFIGLSVPDAEQLAQRLELALRVIYVGEGGWYTSDVRGDRVIVEVEFGVVKTAKAG